MKVSIGAVTGSGDFPGGLFVLGKNISTGQAFSQKVPVSDALDLELPNGNWKFLAMGWDSGSEHFEGNVFCDVKDNVNLTGGDFELNLNVTAAGCSQAAFGPHGTYNFLPVKFNTCLDIAGHIANGSSIDPAMVCDGTDGVLDGEAQSVRVSMMNLELGQAHSSAEIALSGKCIPFSSSVGASSIKLPHGSNPIKMPLYIETFDNGVCTDNANTSGFLFVNGLGSVTPADRGIGVSDVSTFMSVFLHEDACNPTQTGNASFGNGTPGGGVPRLICSAAQWNFIDSEQPVSETYIVGTDIDFSAGTQNTTIASDFKGEIQGNWHILKKGTSPLFDRVSTSAETGSWRGTSIRNLNIENFVISSSESANHQGIIVNTVASNSTSNSRVEISDINIDLSSITMNDGSHTAAVGGVIGKIDFNTSTPASGEYAFVRKIKSMADVSTASSATTGVGGLVGEIDFAVGSGNVALELNSVGKEDSSENLFKVNINGVINIGGLVGQMSNGEIRDGNSAITKISAQSLVGGLVGYVPTLKSVSISNSTAYLEFIPIANSINIGGLVGSLAADSGLTLKGGLGALEIAASGYQVDKVGGVVGSASYTAAPNFSIKNTKTYLNITSDGFSYGGIIGEFTGPSFNPNQIDSSVAMGVIETETSSTQNIQRGGIAGVATFLSASKTISNFFSINGHAYIGGIYGDSIDSSGVELFFKGNLNTTNSTSLDIYIGGVTGSHTASTSALDFEAIKIQTTISIPNSTGTCSLGDMACGLITGFQSYTGTIKFDGVIAYGVINDSASDITENCGDDSGNVSYCSGEFTNIRSNANTDCSGLGASPFDFNPYGSNQCELLFEAAWKNFGYNSTNSEYIAGNLIEPFEIDTPSKWNAIGKDALLMKKSFGLTADLNFTSGYIPIGGNDAAILDERFSGNIIPNGHKIYNITHTTPTGGTEDYGGLFPIVISGARIGLRHDPLYVEDTVIHADQSGSGIIGYASYSNISIIAKNVDIDGTAAGAVGGIVAMVDGDTQINNSSFNGSIDMTAAVNVGGLIGQVKVSTSTNISIEDSFVDINKLVGTNNVGGLIGYVNPTSTTVKIENAYVWFDKKNINVAGNDFESVGTFAGVIGNVIGSVALENVYVDYSNATVAASATCMFGGTGFTPTKNGPVAMITPSGGCVDSTTDTNTAYTSFTTHKLMADDAGNEFDYNDNDDWILNSSGSLILDWEVNGFRN
jgi:hypothetical protein